MNVVVIFGSHRLGGVNQEVETMLIGLELPLRFDFIHLADHEVRGCIVCNRCAETGRCVLPYAQDDAFQEIYDRLIAADAIFIITPVYAGIPSRLSALFERLTSVLYNSRRMNTDQNPLLGRQAAIFSYCSAKICAETELKIIFQKFVMKDYSFTEVNFPYLNDSEMFRSYDKITDYVKEVATHLSSGCEEFPAQFLC